MASVLEMPQLSDVDVTARILQWSVSEGDSVNAGDVIAEIETDKAAMELEAIESGSILKIVAQINQDISTGAPLAVIGQPGEDAKAALREFDQRKANTTE